MGIVYETGVAKYPVAKICNKCGKKIILHNNKWEDNFNDFTIVTSHIDLDNPEKIEIKEVHLCIKCSVDILNPYFE